MSTKEIKIVERIKSKYSENNTEKSKIEELKGLDRKVKLPTKIFAYTYGIAGSLVLGTGMCLAMKVIGSMMAFGIVVGILGIGMISTCYLIYKKILNIRKAEYSQAIIEKSNELLNEKGE